MNIGDVVIIDPYGCGNKHVGIVSSSTPDTICCKKWYGTTTPNLVRNVAFSKNVTQKVPLHVFNKAKNIWEKANP